MHDVHSSGKIIKLLLICTFFYTIILTDYYDFHFVIKQNIQKLLGFAPSRMANKQSGGLFGPQPQQFK